MILHFNWIKNYLPYAAWIAYSSISGWSSNAPSAITTEKSKGNYLFFAGGQLLVASKTLPIIY